jgi:hypothetical protein
MCHKTPNWKLKKCSDANELLTGENSKQAAITFTMTREN